MELQSKITEIGAFSFFESEPVLILFDPSVPQELKDICVVHEFSTSPNQLLLTKGSLLFFGDQQYQINQLGKTANQSLKELGHLSLYFDWNDEQTVLPGAVSLSPKTMPHLEPGMFIRFVDQPEGGTR